MPQESNRHSAVQTDEATSLLRIVNMVRTGEAQTRPEIGRLTGLGRSVVTQRVDQAIELGYLAEGEVGQSSGGRAPRTLHFRSERGRIIVCALGALHIRVGFAELDGDVVEHAHVEWDIAQAPARTLAKAIEMIDELLAKHDPVPVWAVAVGVPGPVDFATGKPVVPPVMPGWNGFDIRAVFEAHYRAPTWVDNDVNLLANGERARHDQEELDLIYCKVGTGIGAGILSRGRIHRGANGAAGDIGHMRVPDSSAVCRCGKVGCLEAVAAGWALVRDAYALAADDPSDSQIVRRVKAGERITPEDISLAAAGGDPVAIELVQRSAQEVAGALATMVSMLNPSVIVIGGVVAGAGDHFLAEVRRRIYELSHPLATRDLKIMRSADDPREPLRGGLELAREQLFEVTFPRWITHGAPVLEPTEG